MRITQQLGILLLLLFSSSLAYGFSLPFFHHAKKDTTPTGEQITYTIKGLNPDETKNAIAWLKAEQRNLGHPPTTTDLPILLTKGKDDVLAAIEPYGYFRGKIVNAYITKLSAHKWELSYTVNPGQPLHITTLKFTITGPGAHESFFSTYQTNFPLKQGQIFNTPQYNATKKALNNIATQHGFLGARFTTNEIKIDKDRYTCAITLIYNTGPQYYLGPVIFKQAILNEGFLQRFVQFKPGTPYAPNQLLTLQQNLGATPYFQSVDVQPDQKNETNFTVPVIVTLNPSPSQRYNFGIGYGTDTGIRGTVGWVLPRITDTGQYFNANLQASQVQTNLDARYVIPGNNPVTQQYYIGGNIVQESPNTSEGHTQKLTVGKTNVFKGWKTTLSLSEQFDQYSLRGDPWMHSYLLLPELSLNKTVLDDVVFPRHGHSLVVKLRGADSALLSSTSFFQTELVGNYIFSPTEKSRLLFRGDLGLTAVQDINTIPLSLQFFAGGSDSVRGYSYQELGPGKYLMVGSVEYQHQVIEKWYAAFFYDAGNAVNSFKNPEDTVVGVDQPNINLSDLLKQSVGIGAVWVSPVGPMELTLAKPLSDSGKSLSLQFSMGAGV